VIVASWNIAAEILVRDVKAALKEVIQLQKRKEIMGGGVLLST